MSCRNITKPISCHRCDVLAFVMFFVVDVFSSDQIPKSCVCVLQSIQILRHPLGAARTTPVALLDLTNTSERDSDFRPPKTIAFL